MHGSTSAAESSSGAAREEDRLEAEFLSEFESVKAPFSFLPVFAYGERMLSNGVVEQPASTPKPLSEGRSVRPMRGDDLAGVVGLALTDFHEGRTDWEMIVKSHGLSVLRETWERAYLRGHFEQTDVEQLTDG